MNLTVAPEPFDSVDARRLVAARDSHLSSLYPLHQGFGPNLEPEQVAAGAGVFLSCASRRRSEHGTSYVVLTYQSVTYRNLSEGSMTLSMWTPCTRWEMA